MQSSFLPYDKEQLPEEFKYPEQYLQFSIGIDFPKGIAWWFINSDTDGGRLGWSLRKSYSDWKNIGNRDLIPFARLNDNAAFFDGGDTTGNPRVIVIDLGNKRHSYEVESFSIWLNDAIKD